jgi:hypothetical protein
LPAGLRGGGGAAAERRLRGGRATLAGKVFAPTQAGALVSLQPAAREAQQGPCRAGGKGRLAGQAAAAGSERPLPPRPACVGAGLVDAAADALQHQATRVGHRLGVGQVQLEAGDKPAAEQLLPT